MNTNQIGRAPNVAPFKPEASGQASRHIQQSDAIRPVRLIRLKEVESLCGLRKSSIYAMQARGEFPRCVVIGGRAVAWVESQVLAWIEGRIKASQAGEVAA